MDRKNQSPQGQTARVVLEFLEVAINCIVFLKGFYPSSISHALPSLFQIMPLLVLSFYLFKFGKKGAFERRRYMNVVVNKARHPQLANYIHSSIFALLPYIQKGLVERVVVIFYGQDQVPLEKFVFTLTINQSYQSSISEAELEFALRAFLVKLNAAEAIAKPLPSGANWEITAYFRDLPSQEIEGEEAKLWIPTDTKQWMQPCEITPIKSMDSDPLKVQLYMEHPSLTEKKV